MSSEHLSPETDRFFELAGVVAATGFASGDRIMAAAWDATPIGPFGHVMWVEADDWRTLFVPNERATDLVSAMAECDSVIVAPELRIRQQRDRLEVSFSGVQLELSTGPPPTVGAGSTRRRIPGRPGRTANPTDVFDVGPAGIYLWSHLASAQRVRSGWCVVHGRDLGQLASPRSAPFGIWEPPAFPLVAELSVCLHDPSHRLDSIIHERGGREGFTAH